jgi:sugar phosphate isomerase/epimerase
VKEAVYRPDWSDPRRVEYTLQAARAAGRLAPAGATVPISTLAGAAKSACGPAAQVAICHHLGRVAAGLARLEQEMGREIVLALEPEPFTQLETVAETVEFFQSQVWARRSAAQAGHAAAGGDTAQAESQLRRHLGVCYDTCHQAVEFEDGKAAIARLDGAGVRIAKVQLSSALRTDAAAERPATLAALERFHEPRWLHQSFLRSPDGSIQGHLDLDAGIAALAAAPSGAELRVHYHVPIDRTEIGVLATTRSELAAVASAARALSVAPVFEVETYTFPSLPAGAEPRRLSDALIAELREARRCVEAARTGPRPR